MLTLIKPIPIGDALQVILAPPAGATLSRVLRRTTDAFTGYDDAGAYLVDEGVLHGVTDSTGLVNGTEYFYRDYHLVDGSWVDGGVTLSATPAATYEDASAPVIEVIRERLAAGLAVEVSRGAIAHPTGRVPVMMATPVFEDTKFPIVTIHLDSDQPEQRFIAEQMGDTDDGYEADGWLGRVNLTIIGWATNADVRAELRRILSRLIIGNLPVFDAAGMSEISNTQQDMEDFSMAAPLYQIANRFTCLAPREVRAIEFGDPIINTTITAGVME